MWLSDGGTLVNEADAAVVGGSGGYGYSGGDGGNGGAGVESIGALTVTNHVGGSISGGLGGDGAKHSREMGGNGGSALWLHGGGYVTNDGMLLGGDGGPGGDPNIDGYSPNGGQGGAGIVASGSITIHNGTGEGIFGGYGGDSYASGVAGAGGAGGTAIELQAGGGVYNTGYIGGGDGGYSKSGVGGAGGAGVALGAGRLENGGYIFGGYGGDSDSGNAGAAGAGVRASGGSVLNTEDGYIFGGAGGDAPHVNGGAAGGNAVELAGGSLTNHGYIAGGEGGLGYDTGGAGGIAVRLTGGATATSTGGIYGGIGGDGTAGGAGGAGVYGASNSSLDNSGTIIGGYGGNGSATDGVGGVGVAAVGNFSLITSGSIVGGRTGGAGAYADAVSFSGGGNRLELHPNFSFTGNVVSQSGVTNGGDTFVLGGSGEDGFDISEIGPTAIFRGFANFEKSGDSSWTLTLGGSPAPNLHWVVRGGQLIGDTDSLAGDIRFDPESAAVPGVTFDQHSDGTFAGVITGDGAVSVEGDGRLTFTVDQAYTGGTTIAPDGWLQLGDGSGAGSIQGDVIDMGRLDLNLPGDVVFDGDITGGGRLDQINAGTLTLNGQNTLDEVNVDSGTLLVGDDAQPDAVVNGDVTVSAAGTLGGHGRINGSVDLASGAALAPGGSIGTLHIDGDLALGDTGLSATDLDFELGAADPSFRSLGAGDYVEVGGRLSFVNTVLHVTPSAGFGPGFYRLFSYGTLTGPDQLSLAAPAGYDLGLAFNTDQKEIDLYNTTGLTLNIWDADGRADVDTTGGGDGTWSQGSITWADTNGDGPAPMKPAPGFAIFAGTPGTVTVSDDAGAISAMGLQFGVDGYTLTGDELTLLATAGNPHDQSEVRVGDGTEASASWSAVIASVLAGADGLDKTGAGTLVLTGTNTYTGGTLVKGGTLEVGDADHPTASIAGDVIVAAGAALAGHGRIGGSVTNLSGNVRPGGSIGILHVAGDYTQGPGGTLTIEIDPNAPATPGAGYSQLQVDGAAHLDGTLALALDGDTYQVGTAYTFLTAAGGISGHFADVTATPALGGLLQPDIVFGAHQVSLTLIPKSGLFATPYGGQLGPAALAIQSALRTILGGFDQAAGPLDGSGVGSGDGRLGLWQRTLTAQGRYAARRHLLLGRTDGAGLAITPRLTLGLAASQATTTTDEGSFHAAVQPQGTFGYGIWRSGGLRVALSAGGGALSQNTRRALTSPPSTAVAQGGGRFDGRAVRASYRLDSGRLFVEPSVETATVHTHLDAVDESGAGLFDLRFDALDATVRQTGGGVRFGASLGGGRVTPWLAVGGTHTFGDRAVDVTQRAGVLAHAGRVVLPPSQALEWSAGLELTGVAGWNLEVAYGGRTATDFVTHQVMVVGRFNW